MDRSFEDRIAAIAERDGTGRANPQEVEPPASPAASDNGFAALLVSGIGILLGAASIMAGRLIEFHFILGPGQSSTDVFSAGFTIALALSFIGDRILRGGFVGTSAITAGFTAVIWFEIELAKMFPELWGRLYDPQSIADWIALAG